MRTVPPTVVCGDAAQVAQSHGLVCQPPLRRRHGHLGLLEPVVDTCIMIRIMIPAGSPRGGGRRRSSPPRRRFRRVDALLSEFSWRHETRRLVRLKSAGTPKRTSGLAYPPHHTVPLICVSFSPPPRKSVWFSLSLSSPNSDFSILPTHQEHVSCGFSEITLKKSSHQ